MEIKKWTPVTLTDAWNPKFITQSTFFSFLFFFFDKLKKQHSSSSSLVRLRILNFSERINNLLEGCHLNGLFRLVVLKTDDLCCMFHLSRMREHITIILYIYLENSLIFPDFWSKVFRNFPYFPNLSPQKKCEEQKISCSDNNKNSEFSV